MPQGWRIVRDTTSSDWDLVFLALLFVQEALCGLLDEKIKGRIDAACAKEEVGND
jgi:hypothetical protein